MDIKICGIDVLKKGGKWLLLEVNGQPSLDFFEEEHERIIEEVLNLLIKAAEEK